MKSKISPWISKFRSLADPNYKPERFFKTGPGEYSEGDIFLKIRMPVIRKFINENEETLKEIVTCEDLLKSEFHEERMLGLLGMVRIMEKRWLPSHKVANSYLAHRKFINNWDLVDCSAPQILGTHLLKKKTRSVLYKLARSEVLWDRRIAILSTFAFIKDEQF